MLIDVGYFVTYGKNVILYHNEKVVCKGPREKLTGLWVLPLKPNMNIPTYQEENSRSHTVNNVYQMSSKEEVIKFLHQCLFCPTKSTLLKAIRNNQLATWIGLTAEAVEKYLPESCPAIDKGHMKR